MVGAIVLVFLFSCLLFLQLKYFKREAKCLEKDLIQNDVLQNTSENSKPFPRFSLLVAFIWFLTIGRGRVTTFLKYLQSQSPILQTRLFGLRVLIINDFRLGKEAFNKYSFSGRPISECMLYYSRGFYGTFLTHGNAWREHRRFSHHQLKEFGFNTHSMEEHTQVEIDDLIKNWTEKKGKPFPPTKDFYLPILSTIWIILAGERASAENLELVQLVTKTYEALGKNLEFPEIFGLALPLKLSTLKRILRVIPGFPGIIEFLDCSDALRAYLLEKIELKKATYDIMEKPRDLMEAYLHEIRRTKDKDSGFYGEAGELNLVAVAMEFFIAGGDTTASTLGWCMLHLIKNPNVQEKIRLEVETAVDGNSRPLLKDRPNCPYTQAFLWEVLRFSPFAAGGLPHQTVENTSIGSNFVPKGTAVLLNIYGIHHDPKIWGDPESFRPERFLSPDGKTFVRHEAICTFSVGQRRCPGEQLALDNMFLFVSAICHKFILKPEDDTALRNNCDIWERKKSMFHVPEEFRVVALDRF